jgi:putative addiction module CopG family antidote
MADDVQFNITLPEDLARLVRDKIESGEYANVNDVIVDGLRGLQEQDLPLEAWLREEVVPALDAYRTNPGEVYTADEVWARLAARRVERARPA